MPPIDCPNCGKTTFTITGWADVDRCPECGKPLASTRFDPQHASTDTLVEAGDALREARASARTPG